MNPHPESPDEPTEPGQQPAGPNPTQLPIEPEFGPMPPPSEPEDPGARAPTL